jgi:Mor family transcriptional regulator
VADVLADFIARLQARLGEGVDVTDIEQQIRRDWAGRWVYIAHRENLARDAVIRAEVLRGVPLKRISQRYGLSEKQIRRIVSRK